MKRMLRETNKKISHCVLQSQICTNITGASVPTSELKVDYNQLIKNVQELNVLAGEGVARVQRTTDGARLKVGHWLPVR